MGHYPEFSRLLIQSLNERDRTPTWLARQIDMNPSTVNRWLNQGARPGTPDLIARIADILGIHARAERQAWLVAAGYGYQEEPEASAILPTSAPPQGNPAKIDVLSTPQTSPPYMVHALPPQGVFGRDDMLRQIVDLLALKKDMMNVPPVALHGMGGVGKTTLVIALAHIESLPTLFPDGVLWVTMGPQPTIRVLLDEWGRALGINLLAERDEEACLHRLRTTLHHRRLLLVVDDVWEVTHAQYFTVAGPFCRTVFTTREPPIAYTLATPGRAVAVDVLKADDALELLRRLAPEAVRADAKNAARLCQRLEFLPLGITLSGRLLANEADVPSRMQKLLNELIEKREARLRLLQIESRPGLDGKHPVSLQAILGMSVERLSQVDQERFAMLATFGGEPLTWDSKAAAYVWNCSVDETEVTISRLIQRGLVTRRLEQFWMHTLLADFAAEMMARLNL